MAMRTLFIFLASIIIASITSFSAGLHAQGTWFYDVPSDHWAKDAIEYVVNKGIMKGMNATTFAPDSPITRAQFATVMYRLDTLENKAIQYSTRDAQRRSDVNTILNAVYQYAIDNNGEFPTGIQVNKPMEICKGGTKNCPVDKINLDVLLQIYITKIPADPLYTSANSTQYTIMFDPDHRVIVAAPLAEAGEITVTR